MRTKVYDPMWENPKNLLSIYKYKLTSLLSMYELAIVPPVSYIRIYVYVQHFVTQPLLIQNVPILRTAKLCMCIYSQQKIMGFLQTWSHICEIPYDKVSVYVCASLSSKRTPCNQKTLYKGSTGNNYANHTCNYQTNVPMYLSNQFTQDESRYR